MEEGRITGSVSTNIPGTQNGFTSPELHISIIFRTFGGFFVSDLTTKKATSNSLNIKITYATAKNFQIYYQQGYCFPG